MHRKSTRFKNRTTYTILYISKLEVGDGSFKSANNLTMIHWNMVHGFSIHFILSTQFTHHCWYETLPQKCTSQLVTKCKKVILLNPIHANVMPQAHRNVYYVSKKIWEIFSRMFTWEIFSKVISTTSHATIRPQARHSHRSSFLSFFLWNKQAIKQKKPSGKPNAC